VLFIHLRTSNESATKKRSNYCSSCNTLTLLFKLCKIAHIYQKYAKYLQGIAAKTKYNANDNLRP